MKDRAVQLASKIKAKVLTVFKDGNSCEYARRLIKLEVKWYFALESHPANFSCLHVFLHNAYNCNWSSNIFKEYKRCWSDDMRVDPFALFLVRKKHFDIRKWTSQRDFIFLLEEYLLFEAVLNHYVLNRIIEDIVHARSQRPHYTKTCLIKKYRGKLTLRVIRVCKHVKFYSTICNLTYQVLLQIRAFTASSIWFF